MTGSLEIAPRRDWALDTLRVALLVAAAGIHLSVLAAIFAASGTPDFERRDWSAFRDAGARVDADAVDDLYAPRPGGFPFLHPPAVAVLAAPLAELPAAGFYGVMVAVQLLSLLVAGVALARVRGRERLDVAVLLALASAPWAIGLVLGQPSAWFVASWALGLAWLRRRPMLSGLAFALCALKPPLLIGPALLLAVTGRRRALLGLFVGGYLVLALGLMIGLESTGAWFEAMARQAEAVGDSWKQHTVLALLRYLAPDAVAMALYVLLLLGLGGLTLARVRAEGPTLRALGWIALAVLSLSPYLFFYDALLVVFPIAGLCLDASGQPRARRWLRYGWLAALLIAQHVMFLAVQAGPPIAPAIALGWLVFELSSSALTVGRAL